MTAAIHRGGPDSRPVAPHAHRAFIGQHQVRVPKLGAALRGPAAIAWHEPAPADRRAYRERESHRSTGIVVTVRSEIVRPTPPRGAQHAKSPVRRSSGRTVHSPFRETTFSWGRRLLRNMNDIAETIEPNPADLVESLRDFGYSLPTAVADLIDNSITAGSRCVQVEIEPSQPRPHLSVVDDGCGMSADKLIEAMRLGAAGPLRERSRNDLGRFGLGLKTASLSIGRCLTVITKRLEDSAPVVRRWDVEYIRQSGTWTLLRHPTPVAARFVRHIADRPSGTAVVIEDLDRASFLNVANSAKDTHLADALTELASHLGMVFHRFIEEGLVVRLGITPVRAWDPFLKSQSFHLSTDSIPHRQSQIAVAPFVLPHHSQLTDAEFDAAAGTRGWNAHQGFYIYRCKRLIVPGTWLGLGLKKEEHFKLARIRVDLPNTLDAEWKLNVMKSHVAAPPALRDTFARIARSVRNEAANVYRRRGERTATANDNPTRSLWKRLDYRRTVRFRLDRAHPVLYSLLNSGGSAADVFRDVLSLIEQSVPIDSILQVPSRSLDGSVLPDDQISVDALVGIARATEQFYVKAGYSFNEARDRVLSVDPLNRHREEILARLRAADGTTTGASE